MGNETTRAVRVHVKGRVQGVGYRYYAERVASQLGLVGYVKNLRDGRVEAYAEGDQESLAQFLRLLERGPMMSSVEDLDVEWREPTGEYKSFEVTY
ncbi:MAG TPA: acylphosphatase [bacterium]|nr:acylphosphatase [bacterium]